jgi:putative serine protease PepD
VIAEVVAGSPAETAGLRENDLITAVDGTMLQGESDFAQLLNQHKVGDKLTLDVMRGTQKMTVTVTLGERPPA